MTQFEKVWICHKVRQPANLGYRDTLKNSYDLYPLHRAFCYCFAFQLVSSQEIYSVVDCSDDELVNILHDIIKAGELFNTNCSYGSFSLAGVGYLMYYFSRVS